MVNSKYNTYDATDPIAMYNYLQRFFVFIDNNEVFFETEYPNAKDRYSAHSKLFCSGINPECLRSSMLLSHKSTHSLIALKARWVTLIEKVRLSLSIKAQDSKSNKAYNDNKGYKEKRDSVGQNSGVVASNTAHNSGQQKPVSSQSQQNHKSDNFPRQLPKSAQSGGARVNSVQQQKNLQFKDLDTVNIKFTNNNNNNTYALLDSGSSIHTVPHSSYLSSISSFDTSGMVVEAANDSPIAIEACGTFHLNDNFTLNNTFVAPSISEPIISVSNLISDNNIVICSPKII
jgi:hypothetical protein